MKQKQFAKFFSSGTAVSYALYAIIFHLTSVYTKFILGLMGVEDVYSLSTILSLVFAFGYSFATVVIISQSTSKFQAACFSVFDGIGVFMFYAKGDLQLPVWSLVAFISVYSTLILYFLGEIQVRNYVQEENEFAELTDTIAQKEKELSELKALHSTDLQNANKKHSETQSYYAKAMQENETAMQSLSKQVRELSATLSDMQTELTHEKADKTAINAKYEALSAKVGEWKLAYLEKQVQSLKKANGWKDDAPRMEKINALQSEIDALQTTSKINGYEYQTN